MKEKLPKNVIFIRKVFDFVKEHPFKSFCFALLIFFVVSLTDIPFRVNVGQTGVIRRFGRYIGTVSTPGLNFRIPWVIDQVNILDAQRIYRIEITALEKSVEVSGKEFFTGDENLVNIQCVLQYQIADVPKFLFYADQPIDILKGQLQEVIITECGTENIDNILSRDKEMLQKKILTSLEEVANPSQLGLRLISFNLDWIMPPPAALAAFTDVVDAKEDRYAFADLAKQHKTRTIGKAKGFASRIVNLARAEAFTDIAQAKGAKERFDFLLIQKQRSSAQTMLTEYYKTMSRLVKEAEIFVLRPNQGAYLEVNLLDKVLPPLPSKAKEGKTKKEKRKEGGDQTITIEEILSEGEYYNGAPDRMPGIGGYKELNGQPNHLELPSSTIPIPPAELEVKNE